MTHCHLSISLVFFGTYLSSDTDTAFVQRVNGILVTITNSTQYVFLGDLDIIKVQHTGGRSADTQL